MALQVYLDPPYLETRLICFEELSTRLVMTDLCFTLQEAVPKPHIKTVIIFRLQRCALVI